MYQRYSRVSDGGMSRSQVLRGRLKNALILLLVAAVIGLAVTGVPAILARQDERTLILQRMQGECDEAVRQTTSLSRNAGADSSAILARIRSNLYAIRSLNALSESSGYGAPVSEDTLMTLQNLVDRYLTYLTTGMDTGEYQTNLQNTLDALQLQINALE